MARSVPRGGLRHRLGSLVVHGALHITGYRGSHVCLCIGLGLSIRATRASWVLRSSIPVVKILNARFSIGGRWHRRVDIRVSRAGRSWIVPQ